MTAVSNIVIAIPTFKRPKMLGRLLDTLAQLETAENISVLVADNDAEGGQGHGLCNLLSPTYRWPLRAIIVPQRGIAQARNALVAEALRNEETQFVVMIDDDEWPAANWIDELIKVQRQTSADAVQGSVIFAAGNRSSYSTPDIRGQTGPVDMLLGAGNIMFYARRLRTMELPWFDPAFALTGGEDADFFIRLKAEGASFAWADEAITYGSVPETRENLRWVLTRAYSHGNSGMLVLLKHRPGVLTRIVESGKIVAALLVFAPLVAVLSLSPKRRLPMEKTCRAAGKVAAMFGSRYNEYSTIHGE